MCKGEFCYLFFACFFFFNDTATTEIYTLSLHDALPIWSMICIRQSELGIRIRQYDMEELEYKCKLLQGTTMASSNGYSRCQDLHCVDVFYFAAIYAYLSPFLPFPPLSVQHILFDNNGDTLLVLLFCKKFQRLVIKKKNTCALRLLES